MLKKIEIGPTPHEVFGNPAPLGLIGLMVGCAALTPIAFGFGLTTAGFKTAAMYCLLFGGGCQFLTGMMDFANKNVYGGTIFTAFSFNWFMNAWMFWSLGNGIVPDHSIVLSVEVALFFVFLVLTYGFGFFSKLLFFFLVDIDLLYLAKIIKALTATSLLDFPIALLTVILGFFGFWIAMASLINPVARQEIFKVGGPMFTPHRRKPFDWSIRKAIFDILYHFWKNRAFDEMKLEEFKTQMKAKIGERNFLPDLYYFMEYGCVKFTYADDDPKKIASIRLNAHGIDVYEQLILKKYDPHII